jgi:hypothetical protein
MARISRGRWLHLNAGLGQRAIPAGTWLGSPDGHMLRPASTPIGAYTGRETVPVGPNGTATLVTFPASGKITAQVGPQGVGEVWSLDQCSVQTSVGQLDTSQCTIYCGPAAVAAYQTAPAFSGGASQLGLGGITLSVGEFVFAVWTGGTSGATAQLRVTGTRSAIVQQ